jgi:hypothetical protein
MNKARLQQLDTMITGVLSGTILPVIVYFFLYFSKVQDVRYTLFSNHLVVGNILPVLISHCVLPNLVLFFIFNGVDWMKAAKGVVIVTVILTVMIFGVKLVFSIL